MLKNFLLGILLLGLCSLFNLTQARASWLYTSNPFSAADSYGLDTTWDWKEIESDHFRVVYPKELKDVATRTTQYLEEAHGILSKLLRWEAHYKAQILVVDNSDMANGLTSAAIRFGIIFTVTPPDSWFPTTFYDDWLRLLVFHEYTHFLNLDTTDDFWQPLRYVFGDLLLPNETWPPWMLEGLAVFIETRFTHAGRGRGTDYEMTLRAAVDEKVLDTRQFITLDKVNGTNPYYPGGDTRYQFGYQLMNEITKEPTLGRTFDGKEPTTEKEDLLGVMSKRSGGRVPYFINGNLYNIIGKDFYDLWEQWVDETQKRASANVKQIRTQPMTQYKLLTEQNHDISNQVTGIASSPDGKWLAYTLVSADVRQGLYLYNRKTHQQTKVKDKLYGVGIQFTPDSKAIIYSEILRRGIYYTYSDLGIYSVDTGKDQTLTNQARAKDPDLSRDGKWATFTVSDHGVTGLAIAELSYSKEGYSLGPIQRLITPALYDRVSSPKFSKDGKKIYFTFHPNGKFQEDVQIYDRASGKITTLVSNGALNRFPAINEQGELFYISNLTGVDNLYRCNPRNPKEGAMVSNVATGLLLPAFERGKNANQVYASIFSSSGFDLAEIKLLDPPISPADVTINPPPAPEPDERSDPHPVDTSRFEFRDYSVYPTILPRFWSPIVGFDGAGFLAGAEVFGYDATNRHRYLLGGTYESQLQVWDGYALYSNRSFGPALSLSADVLTSNAGTVSAPTSNFYTFTREVDWSAQIAFPILWTYASLTPQVDFTMSQAQSYITPNNATNGVSIYNSPYVPSVDFALSYSNAETSSLAIASEGGRTALVGGRYYFNGPDSSFKGIALEQENFRLAPHTVLTPQVKGTWISHFSTSYAGEDGVVVGRSLNQILGAFPADNFSQTTIRGYPSVVYFTTSAVTADLDLRFPLFRIFQGWGTNPVFLDNLSGFIFGEATYFPNSATNLVLPSAGGGLRLSTEWFQFPLTFSGEYHKGFNANYGGADDLFFQVLVSALSF